MSPLGIFTSSTLLSYYWFRYPMPWIALPLKLYKCNTSYPPTDSNAPSVDPSPLIDTYRPAVSVTNTLMLEFASTMINTIYYSILFILHLLCLYSQSWSTKYINFCLLFIWYNYLLISMIYPWYFTTFYLFASISELLDYY